MNKIFSFVFIMLCFCTLLNAKKNTIRITFENGEDHVKEIQLKEVKCKIQDEDGVSHDVKLRKDKWYQFFSWKNPLRIKDEFWKYGEKFSLIISYTENGEAWEDVEMKLKRKWFTPEFIKEKKRLNEEPDIGYYEGEGIKIVQDKDPYAFKVTLEKKITKITGRVLDFETRKPLSKVRVIVDQETDNYLGSENDSKYTDSDGRYEFKKKYSDNPPDWSPYVILLKDEYYPKQKHFKLEIGKVNTLPDILMESRRKRDLRDCKNISPVLEWNPECYECTCSDLDLKWYPQYKICGPPDCPEGEILEPIYNKQDEMWELDCKKMILVIIEPDIIEQPILISMTFSHDMEGFNILNDEGEKIGEIRANGGAIFFVKDEETNKMDEYPMLMFDDPYFNAGITAQFFVQKEGQKDEQFEFDLPSEHQTEDGNILRLNALRSFKVNYLTGDNGQIYIRDIRDPVQTEPEDTNTRPVFSNPYQDDTSAKSDCEKRIEDLKNEVNYCNWTDALEFAIEICDSCYNESQHITVAKDIAKVFAMQIITEESDALTYNRIVKDNLENQNHFQRALAWFDLIESLDWKGINISRTLTEQAELKLLEVRFYFRVAELFYKKGFGKATQIKLNSLIYKFNQKSNETGDDYLAFNSGIFEKQYKEEVTFIWLAQRALKKVDQYNDLAKVAGKHEHYLPLRLSYEKKILNALVKNYK